MQGEAERYELIPLPAQRSGSSDWAGAEAIRRHLVHFCSDLRELYYTGERGALELARLSRGCDP